MSNLTNQLAVAEREDVARGIRELLATPLVTEQAKPEAFEVIRRRQVPIARWFDYHCGWTLVVEPRFGYARLAKVRTDHDATRPARRPRSGRAPFDRRRYVLFCVVAAELLSAPVTTVGLLADRVKQATAADPVVAAFDTASRAERMAYVDALRLLESHGAVTVVDGSTESFVDSAEAKVLYRVDSTLLMRLLSAPRGPSQLAMPADEISARWPELLDGLTRQRRYGLAADGKPTSSVQHNLWLRHSILRRLVDDPVVYRHELSEEQRAYLASPTGRQIVRRAAEQAGFVLEERAEGLLLVDPSGLATDSRFPDDSSTANVAGLMLLDTLLRARAGLAPEQLRATADELLRRFPRWAKTYRDADGTARLAADAVTALVRFGLAEHAGARVRALPAATRYAVADPRTKEPGGEGNRP
ncbi:MAG TPA: TIGR02678 family protein [Amycolatopsis sp.]|uniref:TIGR02678 family protein n=1 Tax=Amycolatopsis sp. TaxID=37632 RepID=UPI002B48DCE5|nr:TIGR02678 family protein [Amycolatopsis sp.]HKS50059.1 TIGR02678 family protein [Amycolatopsis sp.]